MAPNNWPHFEFHRAPLRRDESSLPSAVRLPQHIFNTDGSVWPGQDAGFLGRASDPWLFRCEPASTNFRIPEFSLPKELMLDHFKTGNRCWTKSSVWREAGGREDNRPLPKGHWPGVRFIDVAAARSAFDLTLEPDTSRDRYGRTQFGQSLLLARRLVEAGVRLVQVNWFRGTEEPFDAPCWDSHCAKRID